MTFSCSSCGTSREYQNMELFFRLKQHGRKYTTFCFLGSLGLGLRKSWTAVKLHGWWPMANLSHVRKGMGLAWFASLGVRFLVVVQKG